MNIFVGKGRTNNHAFLSTDKVNATAGSADTKYLDHDIIIATYMN